MATKSKSKASKKSSAKSAPEIAPAKKADVTTLGLAGAGKLPLVGDSTFMTASEDSKSQGVPTPRSDGTGVAPDLGEAGEKVKGSKKSQGPSVECGDIVRFVTSGRNPGKIRPAIVIRETDPEGPNAERSPIDLTAFPDAGKYPNNDHLGNVHYREGVLYDPNGGDGTWHTKGETKGILKRFETDPEKIKEIEQKTGRD